ncbi:MAG: beta-ketoacyl synthase chain length factor [Bacteroidales bacterium]|nr:beta-ketoacyl synthase chain length factor [Candidatus Liminaster caballi]
MYVQAANQISIQNPLSEEWIDAPLTCSDSYCRAQDPDFKPYVSPIEGRRMGKVLKRALAVSLKTLRDTGIEHPDAIITGTGLGSVESTEAFLLDMCKNGEQLLKPTHFMQSTHNTIGSLVAIQTKTHGYNSTYSHKQISFESALYDAFVQLRAGEIGNALVEGHDGTTPSYFRMLELIGYVGNEGQVACSEASMATLISSTPSDSDLCQLKAVKLMHRPSIDDWKNAIARLDLPSDTVVFTGENGHAANDRLYSDVLTALLPDVPTVRYKQWFGECYSASALGFYAAAHLLKAGKLPGNASAALLLTMDLDGDAALTLLAR